MLTPQPKGTVDAPSGTRVGIIKEEWMKGRPRQEVQLGQSVGDFIVVARSSKKHRPHHRGGEYYYVCRCRECGEEVLKTMWNLRKYQFHHPLKDLRKRASYE